jgi:hypothetical protein
MSAASPTPRYGPPSYKRSRNNAKVGHLARVSRTVLIIAHRSTNRIVTLLSVSQDAVVRDRKQERTDDREFGTTNESSEPKGQELNYTARISLDSTRMQIDGRVVNLSPGMAATVEIKTGSRTILSYLLSPLLRYRQETLHER